MLNSEDYLTADRELKVLLKHEVCFYRVSLSVRIVVTNWFVYGTFPARFGDGLYDSYMRIDQIRYQESTNEEQSPSGLPSLGRSNVSILKSPAWRLGVALYLTVESK